MHWRLWLHWEPGYPTQAWTKTFSNDILLQVGCGHVGGLSTWFLAPFGFGLEIAARAALEAALYKWRITFHLLSWLNRWVFSPRTAGDTFGLFSCLRLLYPSLNWWESVKNPTSAFKTWIIDIKQASSMSSWYYYYYFLLSEKKQNKGEIKQLHQLVHWFGPRPN